VLKGSSVRMDPNVSHVHPQHALAAFAESLVIGARVAVLGDASDGLGACLMQLGARSVHIWDPDPTRARIEAEHAPEGVTIGPYSVGDTRGRSTDFAIVPDLGLFEDAADLMAHLRDTLGDDGAALIGAANDIVADESSRAFGYYELFDLVASAFDQVRMIAQLPFHGVALATLGEEGDPAAVSVDMQLADGDRVADRFVVLASQRHASLEAYTIIELPPAASPVAVREEATRAALEQARLQAEMLEAQLRELRSRVSLGDRAAQAATELEAALRAQSSRSAELEVGLVARARQLSDLSAEVEEMRAAADAGRIAAAEVEEIANRADLAERRMAKLQQELATVTDANAVEVSRLEEALRDRAQAARACEIELARRDQMVHELVGALGEAPVACATASEPSPPSPPAGDVEAFEGADAGTLEETIRLRAQLDALALDVARRQGEVQASAWRVTELERRVEELTQAPADARVVPEQDDRRLAAALDEVDALRRALAQEHEARVKLEERTQDIEAPGGEVEQRA
jgi:hypothetical protein